LSFCPGKRQRNGWSGTWPRDLDLDFDLDTVGSWSADAVVTPVEGTSSLRFASSVRERKRCAERRSAQRHNPRRSRLPRRTRGLGDILLAAITGASYERALAAAVPSPKPIGPSLAGSWRS
jgi:hypothetical protein